MSPRAHLSRSDYETYDDYGTELNVSGERICAPRKSSRGRTLLSLACLLAIGFGGIWAAKTYPDEWQTLVLALTSLVEPHAPASVAPPAAPVAEAASEPPALPAAPRDVADAPGAEAGEAGVTPQAQTDRPAEQAVTATDKVASEPDDAAPVPLAKPVADSKDPNQKRALAAGLHPDLSRSLLSRLTATDYRNASTAIKTALAGTPDGEVYAWPREAGAKVALFEVKFVRSASAECRRYVVIITKDRWSTTAPAMEICGAELPKRKVVTKVAG